MTRQHFKKLYELVKESGVKSALEYDLAETVKRHPGIVGRAMNAKLIPPVGPEMTIRPCLHGDEQPFWFIPQRKMWGTHPAALAYYKGWISEKGYDYVTQSPSCHKESS